MIEIEHLYNDRRKSYKNYGKVYTGNKVANYMIDYIDELNNKNLKILEPSAGKGSFYFSLIDRLLDFFTISYIVENIMYAVELDEDDYNYIVDNLKIKYNYDLNNNTKLYNNDFLLLNFDVKFDVVIGNPPYVSYRNIYSYDFDRKEYIKLLNDKYGTSSTCDLYVSFFIATMRLLKDDGRHIFICSDSWISTGYGTVLSDLLNKYQIKYFITSPYEYFFDYDTNAIITVVDKTERPKNYKTIVYYDGISDKKIEIDIKDLIENKMRNILCIYPNIIDYDKLKKFNFDKKLSMQLILIR